MKGFRALLADRRGAAGLLVAAALPMMLGAGALAVDLGATALLSRRLQGSADAAALAAASAPENASARGSAAVAAAGWSDPVAARYRLGRYVPGNPAVARFVEDPARVDAVSVTLTVEAPTYLGRIFGVRSVTVSRTAVAARQRMAAFSIGGRLAALDAGALNGLLSGLAGTGVSLTLVDYEALAGAQLDAVRIAGALRARVGGATYAELLGARVPVGDLVAAMADAADGPARAALLALSRQVGAGSAALGDLVDLGPLMPQVSGGEGLVRFDALSAVSTLLRGTAARTVSFDAGPTRVTLALAGGPEQSPWIGLSDVGGVTLRTAQARLYAVTAVGASPLPGLLSPVSVSLPLYAEAARGEARLTDIACSAAGRSVTVDARAGPASAAIAEVSDAQLRDFTRAVTLSDARLLRAPLIEVDGRSSIDSGGAEPWTPLVFDDAAIRGGTVRTVTASRPLSGVAQSLARDVRLRTRVAGLEVPATDLTRAVGAQLSLAAPALDSLLALVTGTAGVRLGQADVRVTGTRCGTAALVG